MDETRPEEKGQGGLTSHIAAFVAGNSAFARVYKTAHMVEVHKTIDAAKVLGFNVNIFLSGQWHFSTGCFGFALRRFPLSTMRAKGFVFTVDSRVYFIYPRPVDDPSLCGQIEIEVTSGLGD